MAKSQITTVRAIPEDVKFDVICLAILEGQRERIQSAIERQHGRIVEKLTGVKVDAGVLDSLVREHNTRAKKLAGVRGRS